MKEFKLNSKQKYNQVLKHLNYFDTLAQNAKGTRRRKVVLNFTKEKNSYYAYSGSCVIALLIPVINALHH
jgi:hypothetical protein